MALPSASRIDFADIVCDVKVGFQRTAEEVVSRCNGKASKLQKGEMYRWRVREESDGRKEGSRSWRAVRKLAEVGLLTARKSVKCA